MKDAVLQFEDVLIPSRPGAPVRGGGAMAVWRRGEFSTLLLDGEMDCTTLADVASGMIEPMEGTVLWRGRAWRDMNPFEAARERTRLGRTFLETHGWVSNLSMQENLLLVRRHTTDLPDADLIQEFQAAMKLWNADFQPSARPDVLARADLCVAGWIRAFLGVRELILLEAPERGASRGALELLLARCKQTTAAGTAILWMTHDRTIWKELPAARKWRWAVDGGLKEEGART